MASTGKAPQSSSSEAPSLLPPRASSSMVQEGASAKRERLQDAEAASDAKQRKCRRLETVGTGGNVEKRGLSSEDDQYYDPSTDEEERKGWDSLEDVVSRYYSSYMSPGKRETNKIDYTGLDQYVHLHNNRVAVVGLAPTHPAIAEKKTVQSIVWNARAKQGTLDMSGKKKKGAIYCSPFTPVAEIVCSDGTRYPVRAAVNGKLVELNDALVKEPSLAVTQARVKGFVAMLVLKKWAAADLKKELKLAT